MPNRVNSKVALLLLILLPKLTFCLRRQGEKYMTLFSPQKVAGLQHRRLPAGLAHLGAALLGHLTAGQHALHCSNKSDVLMQLVLHPSTACIHVDLA